MKTKNPLVPSLPSLPSVPPAQPAGYASLARGPVAQFFGQVGRRLGVQAEQQHQVSELPAVIRQILERPVSFYEELGQRRPAPGDEPLTNVGFALDVSSSMETGKEATIEGFNNQVEVVRAGAKLAGRTTFTDVQFSDEVKVRRVAASVDSLTPLNEATYKPDGMTALYDALGALIEALLQTPGIDSPATATLVTLFTDGGENSSTRYSVSVLRELIVRLEATKRWTFALVGPRGSVTGLAQLLAVKEGNVAAYDPGSVAERTQVFGKVRAASASYMSMRSSGAMQACSLYAASEPTDATE